MSGLTLWLLVEYFISRLPLRLHLLEERRQTPVALYCTLFRVARFSLSPQLQIRNMYHLVRSRTTRNTLVRNRRSPWLTRRTGPQPHTIAYPVPPQNRCTVLPTVGLYNNFVEYSSHCTPYIRSARTTGRPTGFILLYCVQSKPICLSGGVPLTG